MAKRRGHGEGSIFFREEDSLWIGRIETSREKVLLPDGKVTWKRKTRSVSGSTRAEVQNKLAVLKAEQLNGTLKDASTDTFGQWIEWWLENVSRPSTRVTTYESYAGIIKRDIIPRLGGIQLTKLRPEAIQSAITAIGQEKSPRLAQQAFSILRVALPRARRYLPGDIMADVKPPKVEKTEMKVWTEAEVQKFLEAAKDDRFYAVYVLALFMTMRQGEILGLQWKNVDLVEGRILVKEQLVETSKIQGLKPPKSKSGTRTLSAPATVVAALRQQKARLLAEGFAASPQCFVSVQGGFVPKKTLIQAFHRAAKAAGVPDIRFHDLRHTGATMLLRNGVDVKTVSYRLGHSQVSLTLDRYAHVLETMDQSAAEAMERAFGSFK